MRILKIIIGFLLLYGAGTEYVAASREVGSWYSAGVIGGVITMLLICTWLIGTGFSNSKYKLNKTQIAKYLVISIALFSLIAFIKMGTYVVPKNFVEINGLKVPIGKCIDGNRRLISDKKKREDYCKCFVEKITAVPEFKEKYQDQLESDKIMEVFKDVQNDPKYLDLRIEECFELAQMEWTDELAEAMKRNWKKELTGTEFEQTNDIEKYSDCLIEKYRKFPFQEIMSDGFAESEEAIAIDEECIKASEK